MYLGYNSANGRYGILSGDLWVNEGLHCGEPLEVEINEEFVSTRIEMSIDGEWYLVGTGLSGINLESITVHIPGRPDEVKY